VPAFLLLTADRKIHHGVTRKVTDFLTAENTEHAESRDLAADERRFTLWNPAFGGSASRNSTGQAQT
jgi:hypothetical protein